MTGYRRISRWRAALPALASLLMVGCGGDEALYSSLSEQEANDMVALLYNADLPASKQLDGDSLFTVMTSSQAFANAVGLLHANGFPRQQYDTLGDVFAKEGFVSSPLEERARLNHAMSQEIAHTLSSIDGVMQARVHLAVPEQNALSDKLQPASASVFIKHRSDVDLSNSIPDIKALVINGIEHLPYERVTVALFEADQAGWSGEKGNLSADSSTTLETQLNRMPPLDSRLLAILIVVLIAIAIVASVLFFIRSRRLATHEAAEH